MADLPGDDEGAEDIKTPLIILAIIGTCFVLGLVLLAITMMAG